MENTIQDKLAAKLGREPTWAEVCEEVKKILARHVAEEILADFAANPPRPW